MSESTNFDASDVLRWAVVGVGIAGRARARAIRADPGAELVAVHRGRFAPEAGAPERSFAEAVAAADAVAICSPDAVHEPQVRAVLEAGRHALVEFPLADSHAAAVDLFALADRRGLVLHVEHIELLSGVTRVLATRPGTVRRVEVAQSRTGLVVPGERLGFANVARLHRLMAVVGSVSLVDARAAPGRLDARLVSEDGVPITVEFVVGPQRPRRTRLVLHADDGVWEQRDRTVLHDGARVPLPDVGGLFAADQRVATARIREGTPGYVSRARILEVLALADDLADAAGS